MGMEFMMWLSLVGFNQTNLFIFLGVAKSSISNAIFLFPGENGTIDGQGDVWWNMWRQRTLQFTRPNLIEFLNSKNIIISNVIFQNSPFWNIHPVYSR